MRFTLLANFLTGLVCLADLSLLAGQTPSLLPVTAEDAASPTLLELMHQPLANSASSPEDDATLRHVTLVSSQEGFALGDLGHLLKTRDGGQTWTKHSVPVATHFQTACFLTDKIGWIAGGQTLPYARTSQGALFATQDGGETWKSLDVSSFPEFVHLQFFDLDNAIAIVVPTPGVPSGILRTGDGGKTWQPLGGTANATWHAATFLDPETGVLVGSNATIRLVAGAQLGPVLPGSSSPKHLHDAVCLSSGKGIFVGDGGLALRTSNAGVTTQPITLSCSRSTNGSLSFRAVELIDNVIYLAGQPGSVIWRSADGGKTWTTHATPLIGTIHDLDFITPTHGVAVGDLGQIIVTWDGGLSWAATHNADFHLAALSFVSTAEQFAPLTQARYGADDGYRLGNVTLTTRPSSDALQALLPEHLLRAATLAGGGRTSQIEWMLPHDLPDADLDWQKLAIYLNDQTDGHLTEDVVSRLVLLLRMYRPEVAVIPTGKSDENLAPGAVDRLLHDALMRAIADSAGHEAFPEQLQLLHLKPHAVTRVFQRLPSTQVMRPSVEPFEFLPHLKMTASSAAYASVGLMTSPSSETSLSIPEVPIESYAVIEPETSGVVRQYPDLFAGILIPPGSLSRRNVPDVSSGDIKGLLKLAQMQRNAQHIFKQSVSKDESAGFVLANVDELTRGMTDEQAASLLFELARQQIQSGHLIDAQSTVSELGRRYGNTAIASEAFVWIIQTASSAELNWLMFKDTRVRTQIVRADASKVLEQSATPASTGELNLQPSFVDPSVPQRAPEAQEPPTPIQLLAHESQVDRSADRYQQLLEQQAQLALGAARLLKDTHPYRRSSPEVVLPLAALLRSRQQETLADELLRTLAQQPGSASSDLARSELWVAAPIGLPSRTLQSIRQTTSRPHLDATLSDPCWQSTPEMRLFASTRRESDPSVTNSSFVLMLYDQEYLYLAGSLLKANALEYAPCQQPGRTHDELLDGHDRIAFHLDINRDTTSAFVFEIDQRGKTRERAWDQRDWNPKWYVSAAQDESRWRFEAAIPFKELLPATPALGETWNLHVARTIPFHQIETWTSPQVVHPTYQSWGLLQFK